MTFNEAENILHIWGKYLENAYGKINMIFAPHIPESFLPFPKVTLLEAFNIMGEFYHSQGNERAVNNIRETASLISSYVDDEEALLHAAKRFMDPKWRKVMIPALKGFQEEWLKTQEI